MNNNRNYTKLDQLCLKLDQIVKTILGDANASQRSYPSEDIPELELSTDQRRQSAALMRVNHAGEVCAQALYQGQSLVSDDKDLQKKLQQAAKEEGDHLAWCSRRIHELGSHTSYLNPLWYIGSLAIGITAGLVGDKWSLGFLAETETQVIHHLEKHMQLLCPEDKKSYKILQQMQQEEAHHRDDAKLAGATELSPFIKQLMNFTSKIMVNVAYRI